MISGKEVFISIDIETSGPIPGEYSLLSIGACVVYNSEKTFECELKPITNNADPEALAVTGFSLEYLEKFGLEPTLGMRRFQEWVQENTIAEDEIPIFVGFNAAFDWSFVNYYFHKYLGENPFGFAPLDIKSMYMGSSGCSWSETKSSKISKKLKPTLKGDHNALHDAQFQAELFRLIKK